MSREVHVLSLGAGVQSTAVYLLNLDGEMPTRFDAAVFADTGEEPRAVYEHLAWLKTLGGPPIIERSAGRLGDDLLRGQNTTGQRHASIPAYTAGGDSLKIGIQRRQCTKEYKTQVVERAIRRDILGLLPGRRVPRDVVVHRYFGISLEEARRAVSIQERLKGKGVCHFPLLDRQWTRGKCLHWLETRCPHEVPRSACVFCPFKSDREWLRLKTQDAEGWARAVEIDAGLRAPGSKARTGMRQELYLHRSGKPLATVALRAEGQGEFPQFARECEGMCGV